MRSFPSCNIKPIRFKFENEELQEIITKHRKKQLIAVKLA